MHVAGNDGEVIEEAEEEDEFADVDFEEEEDAIVRL